MDESQILKKLEDGGVKLYEIEKLTGENANEAARIRRKFLEQKFKTQLKHVGSSTIDFNDALNRNIENPIGAVQVPLGYAGDLKINGDYAAGVYPILLATTEGRLVAGVARGASVANKAGGVNVSVVKDGMTRDILVRVSNVKDAKKLMDWVRSEAGFSFIKDAFSQSTKHGKLIEVKPYATGRDIHLRFKATTGAAMGMNMVTIGAKTAAEAMVGKAAKETGVNMIIMSESGNMCSDKKPAYINMLEGRGVSVIADIMVPGDTVREKFKAEPELIAELNRTKNLIGSALAGSHGFNAHLANMLSASYLALGQDVSQIVEGAQGITEASVVDGDMYLSVTMPAVEVGTYGGGTARETQKEILKLLGLYGENDPEGRTRLALAELIAATCLVGEANLLATEASGTLASSHGKIKRG